MTVHNLDLVASCQPSLTPDESALLADFRAMDAGSQDFMLTTARSFAEEFPRQRPQPTLVQLIGYKKDQA